MNLKSKYNKVKILSEKGTTEGERQAAKEALKRMEERHPELIARKFTPEDIYKGYQPDVTFDETGNLSDMVWKQMQEIIDNHLRKGFGVDFTGRDFSTWATWKENPDGTRIK